MAEVSHTHVVRKVIGQADAHDLRTTVEVIFTLYERSEMEIGLYLKNVNLLYYLHMLFVGYKTSKLQAYYFLHSQESSKYKKESNVAQPVSQIEIIIPLLADHPRFICCLSTG